MDAVLHAVKAWHTMHRSLGANQGVLTRGVYGTCRAWCGGQCVDTETSSSHCGQCDYACDAGVPCLRGYCCNLLPAPFVREPCLARS